MFNFFDILTFNVLQELSSEADKEATKILEEELAAKDEDIKKLQNELEASKVMRVRIWLTDIGIIFLISLVAL